MMEKIIQDSGIHSVDPRYQKIRVEGWILNLFCVLHLLFTKKLIFFWGTPNDYLFFFFGAFYYLFFVEIFIFGRPLLFKKLFSITFFKSLRFFFFGVRAYFGYRHFQKAPFFVDFLLTFKSFLSRSIFIRYSLFDWHIFPFGLHFTQMIHFFLLLLFFLKYF